MLFYTVLQVLFIHVLLNVFPAPFIHVFFTVFQVLFIHVLLDVFQVLFIHGFSCVSGPLYPCAIGEFKCSTRVGDQWPCIAMELYLNMKSIDCADSSDESKSILMIGKGKDKGKGVGLQSGIKSKLISWLDNHYLADHWMDMAPLLQIELLVLWPGSHKHGCTFHKVTVSSQLPIKAGSTMTHVELYSKIRYNRWLPNVGIRT